jgi:uncharacterized protein YggE
LVQFEIENINLVGGIIDAAAGVGAYKIQGISFGLSDDVA